MDFADSVYTLYIGADNLTGELDTDTTRKVLLDNGIEGWTELEAVGFWQGSSEKSLVVTLSTDKGTVHRIARQLRDKLNQDAIGLVQVSPQAFELVS